MGGTRVHTAASLQVLRDVYACYLHFDCLVQKQGRPKVYDTLSEVPSLKVPITVRPASVDWTRQNTRLQRCYQHFEKATLVWR